eukprot:TRINITY_DN3749_c0_g2_i1.p1 TRINITY_DN3749_c0_g2~~TRINITY_DN3749_c0_g2_i1.p1  ORF type:complete len:100 (-),score=23.64 TRINITY_DN3749_c0_g2_i1:309-587(-)
MAVTRSRSSSGTPSHPSRESKGSNGRQRRDTSMRTSSQKKELARDRRTKNDFGATMVIDTATQGAMASSKHPQKEAVVMPQYQALLRSSWCL